MTAFQFVLADAQRIAKSANGAAPAFDSATYEDAMCDLAKSEARSGESVGAALSRLLTDHDPRLAALGKAAYHAELAAESADLLRKRATFDELLATMASLSKREDETIEAATARLLRENEVVKQAFVAVW